MKNRGTRKVFTINYFPRNTPPTSFSVIRDTFHLRVNIKANGFIRYGNVTRLKSDEFYQEREYVKWLCFRLVFRWNISYIFCPRLSVLRVLLFYLSDLINYTTCKKVRKIKPVEVCSSLLHFGENLEEQKVFIFLFIQKVYLYASELKRTTKRQNHGCSASNITRTMSNKLTFWTVSSLNLHDNISYYKIIKQMITWKSINR